MSNAELWDLDTSGGVMEQIQMLVAPPVSADALRRSRRRRERDVYRRPGRAVNHDCCDSCKEGGDLLCCDRCPAAFHLLCHDPPLIEEELPPGEWLCHKCKITPQETKDEDAESTSSKSSGRSYRGKRPVVQIEQESETEHPLRTLAKAARLMNPMQFDVGKEISCNKPLPGSSKRIYGKAVRNLPKKQAHELDNGLVPLPAKTCFTCNKSCRIAPLIQCDYCPLLFHLDCLNPPLTSLPTGRWMCPNHVEHFLDSHLLKSQSLTERLCLWDRYTGVVDNNTVKVDFLNKIHRKNPPFRIKVKRAQRPTIAVPPAIKYLYQNPTELLPQPARPIPSTQATTDLPGTRGWLSTSRVSLDEQEEWLSSVVSMQSSIAKYLAHKQLQKLSDGLKPSASVLKPTASVAPVVQKDVEALPSVSLTYGSSQDPVLKTLSSSLSSSSSSSSSSTASANDSSDCDSNKPPRAPTALLNGQPKPGSSVDTNTSLSNGSVEGASGNVVSLLQHNFNSNDNNNSGANPSSMNGEVEFSDLTLTNVPDFNKADPSAQRARSNSVDSVSSPSSIAKSGWGDSDHVNGSGSKNIIINAINKNNAVVTKVVPGMTPQSAKVILPGNKTSIFTNNSSNGSQAQRVLVHPANKMASQTSKVITVSTAPSSGRPINSTVSAQAKVGSLNSLSSSPTIVNLNLMLQQWIEGNSDLELSKIDEKLTHILAWQRLQQLLPAKTSAAGSAASTTEPLSSASISNVVSSSTSVSSSSTSNSSKKGLLNVYLSQQGPAEVRSRAMLCPLAGKGQPIPMPYRCLRLGTGADMDVCLSQYGHCCFISGHHATIFYDETSRHFELLNYSEHGTTVDNVLFSCDFSDKAATSPQVSPVVAAVRDIIKRGEGNHKEGEVNKKEETKLKMSARASEVSQPCNCKGSSSSLIGASGAGWEGTALLHHGSYVKLGCLQFVFSIADHAPDPGLETGRPEGTRLPMPLISASKYLHQQPVSSTSLLKTQVKSSEPP